MNCTLFLLAGYIKYGRPHAWIRSNHERLVNIGGTDSMVKDTPMKLKSISDWQSRGVENMPGIQSRRELLFHCADFNNYTVFHELNQTQMSGLCRSLCFEDGPCGKCCAFLHSFFFLLLCSTLVALPGIRVWDVVSELVSLCTVPSPSNPFALDTRYIGNLPLPDRFLVTGALLSFLDMYVVYGNRDELHYDKGGMCEFSSFNRK